MPTRLLRESIVTSESVASMPPATQDRLPRYFLLADDFGCFLVQPAVIRGRVFPLRPDVTEKMITDDLAECTAAGIIEMYDGPDGRHYAWFPGWLRSQREPRKTARRKCPPPPKGGAPQASPAEARQSSLDLAEARRSPPEPQPLATQSQSFLPQASASAQAQTAAEEPAAVPESEHQALVDYGVRAIEQASGVTYGETTPEDGRHVAELLDRFGPEEARRLFDLAVQRYSSSEFHRNRGLTFRMVAREAAALRTAAAKGRLRATSPPRPLWEQHGFPTEAAYLEHLRDLPPEPTMPQPKGPQ